MGAHAQCAVLLDRHPRAIVDAVVGIVDVPFLPCVFAGAAKAIASPIEPIWNTCEPERN